MEIPQELLSESPDEAVYRRYFEAKTDPASFKAFIDSLDAAEVEKRNLFIPEIPSSVPARLPEEKFFGKDLHQSIVIRKHPNRTPVFLHSHQFIELFYVLEGQSSQIINDTDFEMKKGDICFIPPNTRHSLNVFDGSIILNLLVRQTTFQTIFHNFLCTDSILSSFIIENMYGSKASDYIIFHTRGNRKVRETILQMYEENKKTDAFTQDMLQLLLNFLFIELMRNCNSLYELPPDVPKNNLMRYDIIKAIQKNYETVTLTDLAEKFNVTSQYASRLIRQLTGRTFTEILLKIRMEQACSLLRDTSIPVGDIAGQVGYENPEHFIRFFKREYGITPGEYRKNTAQS